MSMLTLLEKIYGPNEGYAYSAFQRELVSIASGLVVKLENINKNDRGWIRVDVSGEDTVVTTRYLDQRFGIAPITLENVHKSAVIRGRVIDSGKIGYGIYVDIGVTSPTSIDALIPLYKMRSHLVSGKKDSINRIIELFCLYDNFPLQVHILNVNGYAREIEAELSDDQLSVFKGWVDSSLDRVIVLGATNDQVQEEIRRKRLKRDVAKIEQLGLLEHAIVCKLGTDAPGIISKLGPSLPRIPLYAFCPRKIRTIT